MFIITDGNRYYDGDQDCWMCGKCMATHYDSLNDMPFSIINGTLKTSKSMGEAVLGQVNYFGLRAANGDVEVLAWSIRI